MAFVSAVRTYFAIRPASFSNAVRLFTAYATSALLRIAFPSRFGAVGHVVRGTRNLRVWIDGVQFEVRPRTNDLDLLSRKHEPLTTDWFRISPGDVVVDVGAHIGRYALRAAAKGAKVVAIEPDPENFRLLRRNVQLNGLSNVDLLAQAMTASPTTLLLSVGPAVNTGTSSVRIDDGRSLDNSRPVRMLRVPGETLDGLVRSRRLGRIDWLKIDVEGHEIPVLEGGRSALDIARRLILEVTDSTRVPCQRIAESHGFRLATVEEGHPASNLLFAKPDA